MTGWDKAIHINLHLTTDGDKEMETQWTGEKQFVLFCDTSSDKTMQHRLQSPNSAG